MLAHLAVEKWRERVFAEGGDIYAASASRMFHVPVEKHGVNSELRQKGKIAELALGYGGGAGALKSMGALELGVPEDELEELVAAWRIANPRIVKFWRDVDKAAKQAIAERVTAIVGKIFFDCRGGMLRILLPSGRELRYLRARIEEGHYGSEVITYDGLDAAKHWGRIETYGPKLAENIVQAVSRDLAMVMPESQPLGPVMDAMRSAAGSLLEDIRLFDIFRGLQLGPNVKSAAFSLTFRSPDQTLTDDTLNPIMNKVLKICKEKFNAEIRS